MDRNSIFGYNEIIKVGEVNGMLRIYLAAVDVIPAATVLIPVFLILYRTTYGRDLRKSILHCLFCLYLAAVFALVGIPNVTYVRFDLNLNLIPFHGMVDDFKNSILNILLFVPLGFFLPVLWEPFKRVSPVILFGLGLSLTIELLQILTYRATDVNDLITNVSGTAMGFLLVKPIAGWYPPTDKGSGEAYALCALSFFVMFFLHPFLSPMIWDKIL